MIPPERIQEIRASAEGCKFQDIKGGVFVSPAEVLALLGELDALAAADALAKQAQELRAVAVYRRDDLVEKFDAAADAYWRLRKSCGHGQRCPVVGSERQAEDEPSATCKESLPVRGLWRCEGCGDAYDEQTDVGAWLWAGDALQHKCPGNHPQAGYFPARWFGDGPAPRGIFGTSAQADGAEVELPAPCEHHIFDCLCSECHGTSDSPFAPTVCNEFTRCWEHTPKPGDGEGEACERSEGRGETVAPCPHSHPCPVHEGR